MHQVCNFCLTNRDITIRCELCGTREHVFKTDPVKQFMNLALMSRKLFKKVVCIAHNAQGYDAQFILKHLVEKSEREKPSVLLNGTKIIMMNFRGVKFIDSLNYFHMPLSSLPKAYGLNNIEKGTFPHFLIDLKIQIILAHYRRSSVTRPTQWVRKNERALSHGITSSQREILYLTLMRRL